MPRLTFSRNRITGEYIIQLVIDQDDLLIPTPIELPSLNIADQLTYLSGLVQAIENNRKEKDMITELLAPEPDLEEEEEEPTPAWDEDSMEPDDAAQKDEEMDNFPDEEETYIPIDEPEEGEE